MSSSNIVASPVQSRQMTDRGIAILVAIGLFAAAAIVILSSQNLTLRSSAEEFKIVVPDKRLYYPNGSSWYVSPPAENQSDVSADIRTTIPTGTVWHVSPSVMDQSVAPESDKRLTNTHGTSWFNSLTGD